VPGTIFRDKFLSKERVPGANVWGESAGRRFGPSGIMNHEGAEGAQRKDGCMDNAKGACATQKVPGTIFLDKLLSNRELVSGIALSSIARG
jgi:hypothetical protein